ncbi:MAG TPA: hypothetical protein VFU54_12095 [Actinomycetota bacterium]|nr:hypothetical protein [Actinomycetota bacterium]
MAIKGKTKRSQGRPVRRPATGPRIQSAERRLPWYRAPAFPATLAVIALLGTLFAAYSRVQEGWARDDVRRFTSALRTQTDQLPAVLGPGTTQLPGFATAEELTSGKIKPKDLAVRASGWSAKLDQIKGEVEGITVGEVPAQSEFDGNPVNGVGGRVPMLTSVRDSYAAAIGVYTEAANTFQRAGEAPAKSALAKALVQQGTGTAARAGAAMDAAANALARLHARYDLDLTRQLPGESAEAFGARYQAGNQQPQGILPN